MAESTPSNFTVMTDAGLALVAQLAGKQNSVKSLRVVASDTSHWNDEQDTVAALTTLDSVKQEGVIADVFVPDNKSKLTIQADFDQSKITTAYQLNSVGLYATDANGTEILYAVECLQHPQYMDVSTTADMNSHYLTIAVGNASQVNITVSTAGSVTTDKLKNKLADYVKTADISKSLGDYAKTVDVNQQLDKKVNIADMRKPANDVAGIEEVNAKQDAIGYTPADDSKVVHDNHDGTININGNPFTPAVLDSAAGKNAQPIDTDVDTLVKPGLYYVSGSAPNNPFKEIMMLENKLQYDYNGFREVQIAYEIGNKSGIAVRSVSPDGSLTRINTELPWVLLSDDSKVAHLSGANNFDTVPTVNNKPVATTDDLTIVYAGVPSLSFDNNGNYTITASRNADIAHITDYNLYYRVKGNGDFAKIALTLDKLTGTIDLSKVTTATNFESYATATNVFGESDPSETVQWSYDPAKSSSTPPSLAIADDGTYTITPPTATPTPIVKYFLYYNVDGQSDSTKLDVGTNLTGSLKELITKPDKTTTYDVQAAAMNANAESGVSNSIKFTYVPIDDSIYGASWDRKSSPTLTRTDAAVGLKAGINGAQNDFDNAGPWKGMHRVADSMGNVFVRIPKFYIRKTQTGAPDNGTATWQVSLVSHGDDWYLPKGFWDFTNSKELDYIDIGAYDATGSSSKLTSVAGQAPLVSLSIADFRSAAKANGTGYQIWDIHANDMLQVLFIIEFATLNSQSIMEGIDNGSSAANSGAADSHKGSSGTAGSGSNAMSYRGIENLYGNVWQFCDGVNFKDNQPWVCEDTTKFQSDLFAAPYVRTSYTATSDTANYYIKALGFDSVHPYAQFTTDDSGSEPTYYADYDYSGLGNTIIETGGYWDSGADVGLFCSVRDNSSAYVVTHAGCRLLKKALP